MVGFANGLPENLCTDERGGDAMIVRDHIMIATKEKMRKQTTYFSNRCLRNFEDIHLCGSYFLILLRVLYPDCVLEWVGAVVTTTKTALFLNLLAFVTHGKTIFEFGSPCIVFVCASLPVLWCLYWMMFVTKVSHPVLKTHFSLFCSLPAVGISVMGGLVGPSRKHLFI